MNRKKVLIALFRLPYPATDGTRYKILYNLATGLKKDFDIEFFVVNIKNYKQEDVDYLEQNFGKVHLFHHSKISFIANALKAIGNGLPLQAQGFIFRDAKKWLDQNIGNYDAVYVHEIRMTEFFINYPDTQKQKMLVDFNDAISMNYRQGVKKMSLLKKLIYKWEGNRVAKYESRVLGSFSRFNIVSDVDKKYLLDAKTYTGNKDLDFSVICHGAPVPDQVASLDKNKLFFMGSLDYEPNRDALAYFLEHIWPGVIIKNPNIEFIIIGGGHIPKKFKGIHNVHFLGFVPSVFEAVKHCKALVAPIRFAGGTPSKILEAMGYGIPVITTYSGTAGIAGAENNINAVMLSESEIHSWVEAIDRVIGDNLFRETIAKNARQLIVEKYSASAAQESFNKRFHEIIEK